MESKHPGPPKPLPISASPSPSASNSSSPMSATRPTLPATPQGGKPGAPQTPKSAKNNPHIVKIPDYLYDRLAKLSKSDGTVIGTIQPEKAGPGGTIQEFKIVMTEPGMARDLPKEYRLKTAPLQHTSLFKETNEEAGQILRSIKDKGDMVPVMNKEYHEFMKQRAIQENTPKRKTNVEERETPTQLAGYVAPVADHPDRLKKQKLVAQENPRQERGERIPKEKLLDKLFALFAEHDAITMKDLHEKTGQPQAYIKEVLTDIAVYSKDGFQLKTEYKTESQRNTQR